VKLRRDGLIWRRAGDDLIALDLTRSQYLASNATAAVVWEALAEGATRDGLVEVLCAHFEVERSEAGADVDRLLSWLESEGLLEHPHAMPQPSNEPSA
jgi:hypothetical protein